MEKHELVDINGNKTGKILTHIEARDPNNVPERCYISVVGVVIIDNWKRIEIYKQTIIRVCLLHDMGNKDYILS